MTRVEYHAGRQLELAVDVDHHVDFHLPLGGLLLTALVEVEGLVVLGYQDGPLVLVDLKSYGRTVMGEWSHVYHRHASLYRELQLGLLHVARLVEQPDELPHVRDVRGNLDAPVNIAVYENHVRRSQVPVDGIKDADVVRVSNVVTEVLFDVADHVPGLRLLDLESEQVLVT